MDWGHLINWAVHKTLVIINNCNVSRASVCPLKANSKLIIDADAILTLPIAFEQFKTVTRGRSKEIECLGYIELG